MNKANKQTWQLRLKTVTPAFVGGAEPNRLAEIRVPSIRGALRAWYRLLVGPELAAGVGKRVVAESLLFGGTAKGEGQGKMVISLVGQPPQGTERWRARVGSGLGYLGFSLNLGTNARVAVSAGTEFTIRFTFPRGLTGPEAVRLYATLWAWITFGGLGSRSHRGLGSLTPVTWPPRIEDLSGNPLPEGPPLRLPDLSQPSGLLSVAQALAGGLGVLRAARMIPLTDRMPPQPAYRFAHEYPVVVWAGANGLPWRSWEHALEEIGRHLAQFRRRPGVDGVKGGALQSLESRGRLPRVPARATFGLPLALQRVRPRGRRFELRPLVSDPLPGSPAAGRVEKTVVQARGRAPSPLRIHLAQCRGGYVAVYTLLGGPWPGRDLDVEEGRSKGHVLHRSDLDLPLQYLRTLPRRKEVKL